MLKSNGRPLRTAESNSWGRNLPMRRCSVACQVFMWIFVGFGVLMHAVIVTGLISRNARAAAFDLPDKTYNFWPMIIAVALMVIAAVLFVVFKRFRFVSVIIAAISAVMLVMIGLDIQRIIPEQIDSYGRTIGITLWRLLYRHLSMTLVLPFMLGGWLFGRAADKADEERRAREGEKAHFDLSGAVLFSDSDRIRKKAAKPE